jgi:hypothetical protein
VHGSLGRLHAQRVLQDPRAAVPGRDAGARPCGPSMTPRSKRYVVLWRSATRIAGSREA